MGLLIGLGKARKQDASSDMCLWYGVQGDFSSGSYKLKRVGNPDLHLTLPIQNKLRRFVENPDGSVKYYLNPDDSRKTASGDVAIIDSTDGNVMLEKPEYYFRYWEEGDTWTFAISEHPLKGFVRLERRTCSPWFATLDRENSEAVSGCWLQWDENDELLRDENGILKPLDNAARYRGGNGTPTNDGKYNSMVGMPRTWLDMGDLRARCKNGTHFGAYRIYNEIAWLQRIEYASLHCQDAYNPLTVDFLKNGGLDNTSDIDIVEWVNWGFGSYQENITYPYIPCGVTAPLGNNTGHVPYVVKGWPGGDKTVTVYSYRGLETPFGYLWMMADDVVAKYDDGRANLFICEFPESFCSPTEGNRVDYMDGYYFPFLTLPQKSGCIQRFNVYCPTIDDPEAHSLFVAPTEVGDNVNQGACDYFRSMGSEEKRIYRCLLGGCAYSGDNAGFGALNVGNKYSYDGYERSCEGFRLCRF